MRATRRKRRKIDPKTRSNDARRTTRARTASWQGLGASWDGSGALSDGSWSLLGRTWPLFAALGRSSDGSWPLLAASSGRGRAAFGASWLFGRSWTAFGSNLGWIFVKFDRCCVDFSLDVASVWHSIVLRRRGRCVVSEEPPLRLCGHSAVSGRVAGQRVRIAVLRPAHTTKTQNRNLKKDSRDPSSTSWRMPRALASCCSFALRHACRSLAYRLCVIRTYSLT